MFHLMIRHICDMQSDDI